MNILCPQCQPCPEVFPPYTNLTSEGPDRIQYFTTIYEYDGVIPTVCTNDPWTSKGCKTTCESTVSQEDADACARLQEMECVPNPSPIPNPTNPGPATGPQRTIYFNEAQTSCNSCEEGTQWCLTIPRGRYPAYNITTANNIARFYAKQDAVGHRLCLSDLTGSCRSDGTVQLIITARGVHVDVGSSGLGTNLWQVSGSLPDGLTLMGYPNGTQIVTAGFAGQTLLLSGTPTAEGIFTFTINVLLTNGDYAYKQYIIEVLGDIIVGHDVSVLLTQPPCAVGKINRALSGSLPPGTMISQTINGDDQISGVTTTSGCCTFTLTYS